MPKIGVIGGSGFIGASVAGYLANTFAVRILDIKQPPTSLQRKVDYVYCDIRNYEEVVSGLKNLNLVIHAAIIQIPTINTEKSLGYEVNFIGTQNVCKAVDEIADIYGMILTSSWHTIGERDLKGVIDEEFGFRPDKVEDRARLYALSKVAQEAIVRFYGEMSKKIYGMIRMGTVLGEGMPKKTAANLFIEQGLRGGAITPYRHSMHRPMLYVNVSDVCRAFEIYTNKILKNEIKKGENSLANVVNVYYPEPITILELAEAVRDSIIEITKGRIRPRVEIIDKGIPPLYSEEAKERIDVDVCKVKELLGLEKLQSPTKSIKEIIEKKLHSLKIA